MPQQIPLKAIPNQSLSITPDSNTWDIVVKSTEEGTVNVSLTLNTVDILDSALAVPGSFIIPCEYQESGNFIFLTQNFQVPNYTLFGVSQFLFYLSAAELSVIRAPIVPPIVATDFNSIAALPLRFAPQGY